MPRICVYGPAATGKTSRIVPLLLEIFPGMRNLGETEQLACDNAVYTLNTPPRDPEWYDMIFEVRGQVSAEDLQWLRAAVVSPKLGRANIRRVK